MDGSGCPGSMWDEPRFVPLRCDKVPDGGTEKAGILASGSLLVPYQAHSNPSLTGGGSSVGRARALP
jgi:hypothetical protein